MNKSEMIGYSEGKNMTAEHLEILAIYMHEVGEVEFSNDKEKAKDHLNAALTLPTHLDEGSTTCSFERSERRTNIEIKLQ